MHLDKSLIVSFTLALFAVVNPLGRLPVYSELTRDEPVKARLLVALFSTITATVLLLAFLYIGDPLLRAFGIDVASFQVAGGLVLLTVAVRMIMGKATDLPEEVKDAHKRNEGEDPKEEAKRRFKQVVVPFAVPMLASPGAMTIALTYGMQGKGWLNLGMMGVIIVGLMAAMWGVFALVPFIEKYTSGAGFVVFTRVHGLILAGIAVQLIAVGFAILFPAWAHGSNTSPLMNDVHEQLQRLDAGVGHGG